MNSPKETIILSWPMDDKPWSHWVQGRGKKTVRDVFREGLDEIRKNPEAKDKIRSQCERIRRSRELIGPAVQKTDRPRHRIKIQLPADHWNEACQRIGRIEGEAVSTGELLAAVIIESKSWKQCGDDDGKFESGFHLEEVISSTASAELTETPKLRLGGQEKFLAWIVAGAATATAVATWLALCK